MNLELTSAAQLEAAESALTYELEQDGLGSAFEVELDAVLARVREAPKQFPVVHDEIRRGLLKRFPFGVFFVIAAHKVLVIGVLHLHRHPGTWKRR